VDRQRAQLAGGRYEFAPALDLAWIDRLPAHARLAVEEACD
jgi:hypothetical protein